MNSLAEYLEHDALERRARRLADSGEFPEASSIWLAMEVPIDKLRQTSQYVARVAELLIRGTRAIKNSAVGMSLLDKGVAWSSYECMDVLAAIYSEGIGVDADPQLSLAWKVRAGEAGSLRAMHELAEHYEMQRTNEALLHAAKWWKKAAELDSNRAQMKLGELLLRGEGVTQDRAEAYKWFCIASRPTPLRPEGEQSARSRRDSLAKDLTAEEIREGEQRAWIWKPVDREPSAIHPWSFEARQWTGPTSSR